MGAPYTDGTYPSGAPILTLGAFTYKCNKISFDKSAETVNVTDPDGAHAGAITFAGPKTGSAELQYAANTSPDPNIAAINSATGVFVANIDGANANCFITSVAIEKPQRGPWTATIGFQVKVN
jgi:hypothetical protein